MKNDRVYTSSGVGTIQQRIGNKVVVRLDNPRGGKLYREFLAVETIPMETWSSSEENFRKEWTKKNQTLSWENPADKNRGYMTLGEVYTRLEKIRKLPARTLGNKNRA
jgi:hypothetical protein